MLDVITKQNNLTIKIIKKFNEKQSRDIRFRLRDDLIYYVFVAKNKKRLCVLAFIKQKIFRITYNFSNHDDFHRIYDRVVNFVYIRQLTKRLRIYIKHCSKCQLYQIKRHVSYDSLQSIIISIIFFHTLVIDFILALLSKNDMNCVLIVIDKFIKKIIILSNKSIFDAKN